MRLFMIGLLATSRQRSHDPWSHVQSKACPIAYKSQGRNSWERSKDHPGGNRVGERDECREKQNRLHLGRCVGSGGCGSPPQFQQRRLAPASSWAQAQTWSTCGSQGSTPSVIGDPVKPRPFRMQLITSRSIKEKSWKSIPSSRRWGTNYSRL